MGHSTFAYPDYILKHRIIIQICYLNFKVLFEILFLKFNRILSYETNVSQVKYTWLEDRLFVNWLRVILNVNLYRSHVDIH